MRTSKFTDEQIVVALRQAEAGTPAVDFCRKLGVTETTFYRWKRRFGDLGVTEVLPPIEYWTLHRLKMGHDSAGRV
jgi:putative transposase